LSPTRRPGFRSCRSATRSRPPPPRSKRGTGRSFHADWGAAGSCAV